LQALGAAAEKGRRRDLVDQATIARAAALPDPDAYQQIVKSLGG
jgi:hypothetical protein